MNELPNIVSYEIKYARTGEAVPVVNGVLLHSIYNPIKEATSLIDAHTENLKNKNEVVVLGLGFGYHITYLVEKLQEFHGDNYKVIIIDPNIEVYNDYCEQSTIANKNVLIYGGSTTHELYRDQKLIHFLLKKPAIIAHGPSFNLYQQYFKSFLTFEAPTANSEVVKFIENDNVINYLKQFEKEATLEETLINEVATKNEFSEMDMIAMALLEMTKSSKEIDPNEAL